MPLLKLNIANNNSCLTFRNVWMARCVRIGVMYDNTMNMYRLRQIHTDFAIKLSELLLTVFKHSWKIPAKKPFPYIQNVEERDYARHNK